MRSAALKSASAICAPIGGACLEPCATGPEPAAEARPEPPADSGSVSAQELPSPTGAGTASEGERSPREAASRQAVPAAAAIPTLAAKPEYKPPVTGSDWGTSAAGMRHCAAARPSEPVSCAASDFELAWSLMPRSNKRAAAERASEAVRSAAAWEGARGLTGGTSADRAPKRPRAPRPPRPPAAAVAEPALGGGLVDAGAPGLNGDGVQPAPPKRGRGRPKGSGKQRGAQQRTTTLAAARLASASAVAAAAVVATTATGGAAAATEAAPGSTDANSAAPPARGGNRGARVRRSAAAGAGMGSGRRARTELSAAGLANRLLALGQDPYFRCEVSALPEDGGLIVQWAFPGGTAGDCNAWVGLHEAAGVNWAASAKRPPYARFKQINENRPVGEKRFTPKELAQLPDGLYFASLHAGDFATVHSAGGYAVSQRVRLVGGRAVALIGLAHAALVPAFKQPPSARASGPARAEQRNGESLETTITLGAGAGMRVSLFYGEGSAGASARDEEEDDDDVGAMPARLALAVPVVHLDLPPGFESAHVKKVYKTVDALSFLDWGLCSDDAVAACRRKAASRAEARLDGGERVHGEAQAAREGTVREEALTTRTSEHYGEATLATVERMLHTLEHLNECAALFSFSLGNCVLCVSTAIVPLLRVQGLPCIAPRISHAAAMPRVVLASWPPSPFQPTVPRSFVCPASAPPQNCALHVRLGTHVEPYLRLDLPRHRQRLRQGAGAPALLSLSLPLLSPFWPSRTRSPLPPHPAHPCAPAPALGASAAVRAPSPSLGTGCLPHQAEDAMP